MSGLVNERCNGYPPSRLCCMTHAPRKRTILEKDNGKTFQATNERR